MGKRFQIDVSGRVATEILTLWSKPTLKAAARLLRAIADETGSDHVVLERAVKPGEPPTFPKVLDWLAVARSSENREIELTDADHLYVVATRSRDFRLCLWGSKVVAPKEQDISSLISALEATSGGYMAALRARLIRETVKHLAVVDRSSTSFVAPGPQGKTTDDGVIDDAARMALGSALEEVLNVMAARQVDLYLCPIGAEPTEIWKVAHVGEDLTDSPASYRTETSPGEGLTCWSINTQRPIAIPDLNCFDYGSEHFNTLYPGARPRKAKYHIDGSDRPVSAIVIPVCSSIGLHGVLRLIGTDAEGPTYLSDSAIESVVEVADLIGRYWSRWNAHNFLKRLPLTLQKLNLEASELLADRSDVKSVLKPGVEALLELVPAADRASMRLIREPDDLDKRRHLEFAAVAGPSWQSSAGASNKKFYLSGSARSVGRKVLKSGDSIVVDHNSSETHERDRTFDDETHLICVPVRSGAGLVGVLDLRTRQTAPFSHHDLALCETVAAIMGQHILAITQQHNFSHGFSDLAHQVDNPLTQALRRVDEIVRGTGPKDVHFEMLKIRGLLRKSAAVAKNAEFFGLLAGGEELEIDDVRSHRVTEIDRWLREHCEDYRLVSDTEKRLAYLYPEGELAAAMGDDRVDVSQTVLSQALGCLLDNAEKYSRSDSLVAIRTNRIEGKLAIAVTSEGLPILPDELADLVRRGYRGNDAPLVTAEGYGIGLWIVDQLLASHPGAVFMVYPTNDKGITRFELRFSFARASRRP